jgi:hypothetical protein
MKSEESPAVFEGLSLDELTELALEHGNKRVGDQGDW